MKQTGKTFRLLTIALATCFTQYISAQNGTWHGNLEVGGNSLTLVFHLNGDSCSMDSPTSLSVWRCFISPKGCWFSA